VGYGSLVITGADGEVEFADVPAVEEVQALLQRAVPTPGS